MAELSRAETLTASLQAALDNDDEPNADEMMRLLVQFTPEWEHFISMAPEAMQEEEIAQVISVNDALQTQRERYVTKYQREIPPMESQDPDDRTEGEEQFVSADALATLVAMGFAQDKAHEALAATGGSVDAAVGVLTASSGS